MRKYENPEYLQVNRLKQRAYYIPENEGAYTCLNGAWDFAFFERDYEEQPIKTGEIDVPSCWQCRGYEAPAYVDSVYPYPVDPPYVPMDNPMGVYSREFTISDMSKQYYLVFEGVSSCLELYINDVFAGYSQGSRLQAEFDIKGLVREGVNRITAKVRKWCSGSYLESQDSFRYNGIFRDVYLLKRPKGHPVDIDVAVKEKEIHIRIEGSADVELYDGEKQLLECRTVQEYACFTVENPVHWNAEQPYLYELVFSYQEEIIRQSVGFVTYGVNERSAFTVNGVEVKLKGVNHHDTNPVNGYCMTDEELLLDLKMMKQMNMNCVRTSHYPPTPKFLEYCNRLGFYVMLETDLETHGFVDREATYCGYDSIDKETSEYNPFWLGNRPEWKEAYMERMVRAYHRDKNQPCIFSWSIGNESGQCKAHGEMVEWLRKTDSRRLIHSEDASRLSGSKDFSEERKAELFNRTDMYSRMYEEAKCLEEDYLLDDSKKLPVFLCEYAHAMGNGPGDMADYWSIIYKYPKFIGGCIWEWADHTYVENGVPKYGGDFNEPVHSGNFCADGLVTHDRKVKAGTLNAKYVYQNVGFKLEGNTIEVTNLFDFTNLKKYPVVLEVVVDGVAAEKQEHVLDIMPKQSAMITFAMPEKCSLGAYVVCRVYGPEADILYAGERMTVDGAVMALWECELAVSKVSEKSVEDVMNETALDVTASIEEASVKIEETGNNFVIQGQNFTCRISKYSGMITQLYKQEKEQLAAPSVLSVWRAPIDNDRVVKNKWGYQKIRDGEALDRTFNHIYQYSRKDNTIVFGGSLSGIGKTPYFHYQLQYEFSGNGEIHVLLNGKVKENCIWLPRLGFEFKLLPEYKEFQYFGKGPYENYCDMHAHTTTGWFISNSSAEYVPYIMPQEHGNHTDCKELRMKDGMQFVADRTFEINVSDYSTEALTKANHIDELYKNDAVNVRIDYKVSGVGSNACGPALAPEYRLEEKDITFGFKVFV